MDKLEEIGTDIDTELYTEYVTNKDLLDSTENSTQYCNGLHGKESNKE